MKQLFNLRLAATCMALFFAVSLYAQANRVSGVVTDANGPLPGVTVIVEGTTTGTTTDVNGRYTVTAPPKRIWCLTTSVTRSYEFL